MLIDMHSNPQELELMSINICQAKKELHKTQIIAPLLEARIMIINMDMETTTKRSENCTEKLSQDLINIAKEYGLRSISDSIYAKAIAQDPLMCDKYEAIETMLHEVWAMDVEFFTELAMVEVLNKANQLYRDVEKLVDAIYE